MRTTMIDRYVKTSETISPDRCNTIMIEAIDRLLSPVDEADRPQALAELGCTEDEIAIIMRQLDANEVINSATATQDFQWHQKYLLTLNEASKFFGISYKKLRLFCKAHPDEAFLTWNGNRAMIKKNQFSLYIDKNLSVI